MSVAQAYDEGRLPKDCPYVKDDKEYKYDVEYIHPSLESILIESPAALTRQYPIKFWSGPIGE